MKQEIIDFRNSQFDNANLNYAKIFENYDTLKIERFDPTNPEHQNITDEDCNIYITGQYFIIFTIFYHKIFH